MEGREIPQHVCVRNTHRTPHFLDVDTPTDFDRICYVCPRCGRDGAIRSIWASLSHIGLEGYCEPCQTNSVRIFTLSEIDEWLKGSLTTVKSTKLCENLAVPAK